MTPNRSATGLRTPVLLALALAVVCLAYRSVPEAGFVWDDHPLIDQQPFTQQLRPLPEYFDREFWADPSDPQSSGFYRPLVSLSYSLEWQAWQGEPAGFHATNLLLHLVNCALVFALVLRAGAGGWAAFLAALLFGLHPRLTESVAWISGRTDVLASCFSLLALFLYRPGAGAGMRRAGAGACLLLGLLAKEVALASALALVAVEVLHARQVQARRTRSLAALAPVLAAVLVWAVLRAVAAAPEQSPEAEPFTLLQRFVLFPLEGLGRYLAMLVDPLRPRVSIGVLGIPDLRYVALGALVAAPLVAGVGWRLWRRADATLLPLFVLGTAAIAPVLNVVPLPANVPAADRYLYLSLAALAIALGAASARLTAPARPLVAAAAALAALAFGLATDRHVPVWSDDLSLWAHAVRHAPDHDSLPHAQLGYALAGRGRPDEAIASYRRALAILQQHPSPNRLRRITAQANLALALSEIGADDEARRLLEEVVRSRPGSSIHRLQLAAVHSRALRFDEAAAALDRALELAPGHPIALHLRQQVEDTRRRWQALPPQQPDEDLATLAERATVMAQAGRIRDADALWLRVVEAPEAPPRLVQRAAVHLAYGGYRPDAARRSFERLRTLGADPVQVARLEHVLDERRLEP
jgi:tetratricopeptide (TPR) repeat protein